MIIRGSYAIKDIINRDINDYDLYATEKEIRDLKQQCLILPLLNKAYIKGYLSKTIEINLINPDNEYYKLLFKELENFSLEEVLLEGVVNVYILPLELCILEKMMHKSPNMKEKWAKDMNILEKNYIWAKKLKEKYKELYTIGRKQFRENTKNYILSPHYKKRKKESFCTIKEMEEIIKNIHDMQERVSYISWMFNSCHHREYIEEYFYELTWVSQK